MIEAFVYGAVRSPRGKGKPGAPLSALLPHQLAAQLVDELRRRHGDDVIAAVDRLHLGCVGQVRVQGGHLALVTKIEAGLSPAVSCQTVNNFCVAGLTAIGTASAAIRSGDTDLALAGGVEMMSHVPFLADEASYYTDPDVAARLQFAPVGVAADLLAHEHAVERDELDALTLESHRRAAEAWAAGAYDDQVVSIHDADGRIVLDRDETIRADMTGDYLASLPSVFEEMGRQRYDAVIADARPAVGPIVHRHTIAHCPPIADGAALVLVGSAEVGEQFGLQPLARIVAVAEAGDDHVDQLTAGERAMGRVLDRTGLELDDFDLVEYMEAFAVVPALFHRRHEVDRSIVNPNGGHLAMGHPMGATGAILVTAAVHELRRRAASLGLVVAHGGSGVGAAVVLEAV